LFDWPAVAIPAGHGGGRMMKSAPEATVLALPSMIQRRRTMPAFQLTS